VKDELHVELKQLFVDVQVTVTLPPQAFGADGLVGLLDNVPPLLLTEASHAANCASTWA
jgi:hypothetical protein